MNRNVELILQKKNLIFFILLGGLLLRLILFCGEGLGDDPNYYYAFKKIYDGNIVDSQYYYRFSYWIIQVIIWKAFGISEFTFILPVLLSSIGCIYVVYLIAKELFGLETGLIAATLMAVNPFEVLNATLISTDVNLSLYMLLSVYFFILAQKKYNRFYFYASALFVFLAFVNKLFGVYIIPVIGLLVLIKEGLKFKNYLKYFPFSLMLFLLFMMLFAICWLLVEDPFTYINIFDEDREPPHLGKFNQKRLLIYPKQMFLKNEFGERLHGYHFYTVVLSIFLIRKRDWKKVSHVLLWFLIMFLFINFFPHKIKDLIPYTIPRIFRYFVIVIPPSILFVSYFWNKFRLKYKKTFKIFFIIYLLLSLYWCYDSTRIARISYGEVREARNYLKSLGEVEIYSDWHFASKIERLDNSGIYDPRIHKWIGAETPEAWKENFLNVSEGYVVTGGSRMTYYGCPRCIPNMGDFEPPENWNLVKEFDKELYPPWKKEPLRIWYVENNGSSMTVL